MDCSNIVGYLIHIFIDVFVTPVGKESLLTPRKKLILIYSLSKNNRDMWNIGYDKNKKLYPIEVNINVRPYPDKTDPYSSKSNDKFTIIEIVPTNSRIYPKYLQVFLRLRVLPPLDFDVCITIGIVTPSSSESNIWTPIMSIWNRVNTDMIMGQYNFDTDTYVKPVVLGLYTLIFMQMLQITTILMCEFPTQCSTTVKYLKSYKETPPLQPYNVISPYMMVFIWLSAWVQSVETKGINNISLLSDSIFGEINNQLNTNSTKPTVSITLVSKHIQEAIEVIPTNNSQFGSKSSNATKTITPPTRKERINSFLSTMVSQWMGDIPHPPKEVIDQIMTQIKQTGITTNYYLTPDILGYLNPKTENTEKPITLMLNNLNIIKNMCKYWSNITIPHSLGYDKIESLATHLNIPTFFWLSLKQLLNTPPTPTPTPTHSLGDPEHPNRSVTKCLRGAFGCTISGGSGTRRNRRKMKPVMRCVGRTCRQRMRRTVYKIGKNRRRNRRTCRYRECA
jgi:hypothetical protein